EFDLVSDEVQCVIDDIIEVQLRLLRLSPLSHGANSMNDFTGVACARYDARCQLLQFCDINIVPREPPQACFSVRDDCCERLLYLMGDRSRHFAKRRNSCSMSVVGLDLP